MVDGSSSSDRRPAAAGSRSPARCTVTIGDALPRERRPRGPRQRRGRAESLDTSALGHRASRCCRGCRDLTRAPGERAVAASARARARLPPGRCAYSPTARAAGLEVLGRTNGRPPCVHVGLDCHGVYAAARAWLSIPATSRSGFRRPPDFALSRRPTSTVWDVIRGEVATVPAAGIEARPSDAARAVGRAGRARVEGAGPA